MADGGKVRVPCACGASLTVRDGLAGRLVKCPKCAQSVRVPAADVAPPPFSIHPKPAPDGWRAYARWALALALLPLIVSVLGRNDDVTERVKSMIERDPSLAEKIAAAETKDEFLSALPDGRVEGALHGRNTWAHWLYALLSAGAFWGLILLLYPMGRSTTTQIWIAGLFTGTVGILLLLGLQWAAAYTQGVVITGRSILVIFFYVVKFIGFSYRAALDPANGFLLSMMGFTFGVGLCEELCKALPLVWHFKKSATLDTRGAVAWGLAAGIGFGVSEGIIYSSDSYNGISTGGIYVVRFVSCVALHAVWSATNALLLWRRQAELQSIENWYDWFLPLLKVLGFSMILHGFYDTFLKRDMPVLALVTAVVSFALFFWLYEKTVRDEASFETAPA